MKASKLLLTVALSMVALGLLFVAIAFVMTGFQPSAFNNAGESKTETYLLEEVFDHINLQTAEADICILPSEDGTCRVICEETEKITHTVEVVNGTLRIRQEDTRAWYEHIGIFWAQMRVTVYLPEHVYQSMRLESVSGKIQLEIPLEITGDVSLKSTSGDISVRDITCRRFDASAVSGKIIVSNLQTKDAVCTATSGDLSVKNITVDGALELESVSGKIVLDDGHAARTTCNATSGDVKFENCLVDEHLEIHTVSGRINLISCDADTLRLGTVSGDVRGELLSEKTFQTQTTSGNVRVPSGQTGGLCYITTTSGNITFQASN